MMLPLGGGVGLGAGLKPSASLSSSTSIGLIGTGTGSGAGGLGTGAGVSLLGHGGGGPTPPPGLGTGSAGASGGYLGLLGTGAQDPPPSSSASTSAASPDGYGLLGLLGVIRMTDRDLATLALGADLTTLQLNLHAPDPLHTTFGHPWAPSPCVREPVFSLPASFKVPQPALKTGHFSKFEVGTLLYIFYAMPRDVLQAYAAQELYTREWRYHKDSQTWYRRVNAATDGAAVAAAATSGYVCWDVGTWEQRPFAGSGAALAAGFLTEEEAKVKGAAAASGAPATAPTGGAAGTAPAAGASGTGGAVVGAAQ